MIKRTVLFVDDEVNVLNSLKRGLMDEDYDCEFASSAKDALKILEKQDISVIVTDMRMPEMDGLALLKIVKDKYPDTVRIVLSGYTQLPQVLLAVNQGDIFKFITKPWKLEEELKNVIQQAIDYYNLQVESIELKKALEARNASYQNILKMMNDILANDKKNFITIKEVSTFIFDSFREKLTNWNMTVKTDESLLSQIEFAKTLYLAYLDSMPAKVIDFDLDKIIEDMEKFFSGMQNINKAEFNRESLPNQKCTGDYGLLYFALTFILNRLLEIDNRYNVKFTFTSKESTNGVGIKILIEVNPVLNKGFRLTDTELSFMESFMNMVINTFNGVVLILKMKNSVVVKFEVVFSKSK